MAVYHCSIKEPLSRGKGKSLIRKAAYNGRTQLLDERTGETTKNYAYKGGLIESYVTFDPKCNAPEWFKTDPQRMLTAAVLAETRKDAREGQEIVFGFIDELGLEKNRYMLNDFLREQFTRRDVGRVVVVNIHAPSETGDQRNTHAHALLLLREAGPEGFGHRLPALEPGDYERIRQKWAEKGAKELRKEAKIIRAAGDEGRAAYLELEADRYTEGWRPLEQQRQAALERGDLAHAETLNREATKHRGPAADAMEKQGMETERGNAYRDTEQARKNNEDLKIELAQVQQAIADYEREWADNLAKAAIAKEQAAGQQEKEQPPPAHEMDRESYLFSPKEAEREGTLIAFEVGKLLTQGDRRSPSAEPRPAAPIMFKFEPAPAPPLVSYIQVDPIRPPEILKGTPFDILEARKQSSTPHSFAAALAERGLRLAVVSTADRNEDHSSGDPREELQRLRFMKENGVWMLQEGGLSALDAKQRDSVERSYDGYRERKTEEGKTFLRIERYVSFVQRSNAERLKLLSEEGRMLDFADDGLEIEDRTREPGAIGAKAGSFVIVNQRGYVYHLNERTTGHSADDAQKFLAGLDRTKFLDVTTTRQAIRDEFDAARMDRATHIHDYSTTFRNKAKLPITAIFKGAKAGFGAASKAVVTLGNVIEGLLNFFSFDGPKTKEQIAIGRANSKRSAHVAAQGRAAERAERGTSLYASEHERITHRLDELRALDEQRRKDYQRQRGDDHDRDR